MKERPILFNASMVRALLDGSKTQTRRLMKPQLAYGDVCGLFESWYLPQGNDGGIIWPNGKAKILATCPYGQPGERLWVREAYRFPKSCDELPPRSVYGSEGRRFVADEVTGTDPGFGKYRPGMFMPRWVSRINLEITGVRVELLQNITADDAMAEGIVRLADGGYAADKDGRHYHAASAWHAYASLWEQINGAGSWTTNPWVWVVEFRRLP